VPIAVVAGAPGVGKTALVVHWANLVRDEFPDGLLYADLRGFDIEQPLDPSEVLATFLRSLGVAGGAIPHGLAERSARFRTCLDQRRVLIVLDNADSD
jgi:predicted ATPase